MTIFIPIINFLTRFYWIKKKLIQHSKAYIFKYCILPIVKEIKHEKLCTEDYLTVDFAINSEPFKGIIEHYLKANDYNLTSKDIAIALNMGLFGHSNKTMNQDKLINVSTYITIGIKERITCDEIFKDLMNKLGKDISSIQLSKRKEIEKSLSSKKQIFKTYFNIYSSELYSEKITIYHPAKNKTYLEWKREDSLTINIYKYDIPRGFFLTGFDYSHDKKWLKSAVRIREKEYFNPTDKTKGELIWLN